MRTYHTLTTPDRNAKLPCPVVFKKIKIATVTQNDGEPAKTTYREGYRVRMNSRTARAFRRSSNKPTLIAV